MPYAAEVAGSPDAVPSRTSGMNAVGSAARGRVTPNTRFHPRRNASPLSTRSTRLESGPRLTLKHVIGTTTASANAFDADSDNTSFVTCAGAAVILSQVNERWEISQQLFRVGETASAVNSTPSFYNPSTPPVTPSRHRQGSPLKDRGYGLGSSTFSENAPDSPAHGKANTRSREATCVSLSSGGQLLAVGETGYSPRVVIFSTASNTPSDVPLSVLTDHTFGVTCVAFSPDSQWLCTLGNGYDGFILIYSIDVKNGSATLHSSNKCSNVSRVVWMGQSVVSIGIRHVKVWRLDQGTQSCPSRTRPDLETDTAALPNSPIPKTLLGRKCLLGALIDATFTAAEALSDNQAVLCSAQGDVCLLDDTNQTQQLHVAAKFEFSIECVTIDRKHGLVWFAGEAGIMKSLLFGDLIEPMAFPPPHPVSSAHELTLVANSDKRSATLAIGIIRNRIITIGSDRLIQIWSPEEGKGSHIPRLIKRLPAHDSAVLGVCTLLPKLDPTGPDFFTFSKKGSVIFWMLDGTCAGGIEINLGQPEDGVLNELRVVILSTRDNALISGDKTGVIRLTDRSGNQCSEMQAHSSDINGIATAEVARLTVLASCGRDRTLQLFHKKDSTFELFQTLDDHAASVTDLMFLDEALYLLSISSDRTFIVRRLAHGGEGSLAYLPFRVINLKASPISFTHVSDEPSVVVVSMMDRQIQRYDIASGRLLHSFKASDHAGCETVVMGALEFHKLGETGNQSRLLAGVSSTDKSIRIHDYISGSLLAREPGQKAVSAIKLIQGPKDDRGTCSTLVSCALDSTIMIYDLHLPQHHANTPLDSSQVTKSLSSQPLRRILSKGETSSFGVVTPLRSTSRSRMQRKTSNNSSAGVPKSPAATPKTFYLPASGPSDGKSSQSSTGPSPQHTAQSRSKPSSPDNRRRSKSPANPNDLNDAAEHVCKSLQAFRKRVASAAMDKIDAHTARELESELTLTARTLDERASEGKVGGGKISDGLLDIYLARMIDERLALRTKSDENRRDTEAADVEMMQDKDRRNTTPGARRAPETDRPRGRVSPTA